MICDPMVIISVYDPMVIISFQKCDSSAEGIIEDLQPAGFTGLSFFFYQGSSSLYSCLDAYRSTTGCAVVAIFRRSYRTRGMLDKFASIPED